LIKEFERLSSGVYMVALLTYQFIGHAFERSNPFRLLILFFRSGFGLKAETLSFFSSVRHFPGCGITAEARKKFPCFFVARFSMELF
jgi:hypothetical protein